MTDELEKMTPNQRRALDAGLAALDTMAATWAAEVRLHEIAKHFAAIADPDERATRIAAMVRQGFSEGAYRCFIDHKDQIELLSASNPAASAQSAEPVAWRYLTPTGWHATTKVDKAVGASAHHDMEPLYAAPQPSPTAAPAQSRDPVEAGDEVPVEVWHGDRKVTIYTDCVLRVWGANIESQMSDAPRTLQSVQDAMDWLYAPFAVVLDDERAAFEAWADERPYDLPRVPTGQYESHATESAWDGWQARAALPQPVAQPVEQISPIIGTQAPFSNCRFKFCDLPGQCRDEGKCHHPAVPAAQPVKQTRALTDEERLIEAIRRWASKQKPLDAASQKILYDNLWDLYVDDAARPASGETE